MPRTIPIDASAPAQEMRLLLEGTQYILFLDYQQRQDRYFLTLSDLDNVPIAAGVKVVLNRGLLRKKHHDPRCPTGEIIALDQTVRSEPSFGEIGALPEGVTSAILPRVVLQYVTRDEIDAMIAQLATADAGA